MDTAGDASVEDEGNGDGTDRPSSADERSEICTDDREADAGEEEDDKAVVAVDEIKSCDATAGPPATTDAVVGVGDFVEFKRLREDTRWTGGAPLVACVGL